MKKRIILILSILIVSVLVTGCIVKNESKASYSIKEGQSIHDTYYYEVKENFDGMSLKIEVELTKGEVEFELIDPEGNVRWTEIVNSEEEFIEVKEFEKLVGDWNLYFESIDNKAEGKLRLKFNEI